MPRTDSIQPLEHIQGNGENSGSNNGSNEDNDQQQQYNGESTDHESGVDDDNGDQVNIGDEEDNEDDGDIEVAATLAFNVDMLRDLGVNWLEHPEYATHRLIVERQNSHSRDTNPQQQQEHHHQYFIIDRFLMSASFIFREVIMNEDLGQDEQDHNDDNDNDNNDNGSDDDGGDEVVQQSNPPSCLRICSAEEAATIPFPPWPSSPRPLLALPEGRSIPSWLRVSSSSERIPLLRLHLPYPEHFPALLRAMYDGDLDHWQETCFRPETIGPITQNVDALVCPFLAFRCRNYLP